MAEGWPGSKNSGRELSQGDMGRARDGRGSLREREVRRLFDAETTLRAALFSPDGASKV